VAMMEAFDVIVANNLGATTYLWNDGSTNEDRAALIADTYMVTVTDSTLCSIALTIEVTETAMFYSSYRNA
jgi:hypothetical protein